jgi:hypothetical protein
MAMKGCPSGHWYDDAEYESCPYCSKTPAAKPEAKPAAAAIPTDIGKTVPLHTPVGFASDIGKTVPLAVKPAAPDVDKTQPLYNQTPPPQRFTEELPDSDKTQPLIRDRFADDYLVGWLVCVSGASKGKHFTIHTEVNHIGRNSNMDICITGDNSISRENHASITYDTRDRLFYLAPGGGRAIIRLGGKPAPSATTLSPYDEIELGATKLVFVPLCGNSFDWSNYS